MSVLLQNAQILLKQTYFNSDIRSQNSTHVSVLHFNTSTTEVSS